MRENRTHGSEGGESGSTGLPYPYCAIAATRLVSPRPAFLTVRIAAKRRQHIATGVSPQNRCPQNRCPQWRDSREAATAKLTIANAVAATRLNGCNDSSTPG